MNNQFQEDEKYLIIKGNYTHDVLERDPDWLNSPRRFSIIKTGNYLINTWGVNNLEELLNKNPEGKFESSKIYTAYIITNDNNKENYLFFDKATSPEYAVKNNNGEKMAQKKIKEEELMQNIADIVRNITEPQIQTLKEELHNKDMVIQGLKDDLRAELNHYLQNTNNNNNDDYVNNIIERYNEELNELRQELMSREQEIINQVKEYNGIISNLQQENAKLQERIEFKDAQLEQMKRQQEENERYREKLEQEAQEFIDKELKIKAKSLQDDLRAKENETNIFAGLLQNLPQLITMFKGNDSNIANPGNVNSSVAQQSSIQDNVQDKVDKLAVYDKVQELTKDKNISKDIQKQLVNIFVNSNYSENDIDEEIINQILQKMNVDVANDNEAENE